MSAPPYDPPASLSASGYEDGLGRRLLRFDRETGAMLETLALRPEFLAFESALRHRVDHCADFVDDRFARLHAIERDEAGRLVVVSELVAGERLCDLVEMRAEQPREEGPPTIDAALGFLLHVLPALGTLHTSTGTPHGVLGPGRVVLKPGGVPVLLDYVFAQPLQRLHLTRERLWNEFRIATRASAGPSRLDATVDVGQASLCALSIVIGRPLAAADYPGGLAELVGEVTEIALIRGSGLFASALRRYLEKTLPLPGSRPYRSIVEAEAALVSLVRNEIGVDACCDALGEYMAAAALAPEPEPAHESAPLEPAPYVFDSIVNEVRIAAEEPAIPPSPTVHEFDTEIADLGAEIDITAALNDDDEPTAIEVSEIQEAPHIEPPIVEIAPAVTPPAPPIDMEAAAPATFEAAPAEPAPAEPELVEPVLVERAAAEGAFVEPVPVQPVPVQPARIEPAPEPIPAAASDPEPAPEPAAPETVAPALEAEPAPRPESPRKRREHKAKRDKLRSIAMPPPAPAPRMPVFAPPPGSVRAPSVSVYAAATQALWQPTPEGPIGIAQPIALAPIKVKPKVVRPPDPVTAPAWHGTLAMPSPEGASSSPRGTVRLAVAAIIVLGAAVAAGRAYLPDRASATAAPPAHEAAPKGPPAETPAPVVPSSTQGSLVITSQPAGARVLIDGQAAGETPLTLDKVAPGRHIVTLMTSAVSVRRTVRVEAGRSLTLDIPVYSGWVAVFSPIPLEVSEGGRQIGTTDQGRLMLAPGRHELTLSSREFGYTANQTVEIAAGEERAVTLEPRGTVNLNASPWAEVWIDGHKTGETPIANLQVPLGTREVVFKHPQFGERKMTLIVTATAPAALSVDFTKSQQN